MTEPGPINRAALGDLLETTGGDPSFLAEPIDSYVADTDTLLASMRHALATGNAEELRRAAHSLKSNSATFGALRLTALCAHLEEQAAAGELDGAAGRVAEVENEFATVKPALRAAYPGV